MIIYIKSTLDFFFALIIYIIITELWLKPYQAESLYFHLDMSLVQKTLAGWFWCSLPTLTVIKDGLLTWGRCLTNTYFCMSCKTWENWISADFKVVGFAFAIILSNLMYAKGFCIRGADKSAALNFILSQPWAAQQKQGTIGSFAPELFSQRGRDGFGCVPLLYFCVKLPHQWGQEGCELKRAKCIPADIQEVLL